MFSRFRTSVASSTTSDTEFDFALDPTVGDDQDLGDFLQSGRIDYDDLILQPSPAVFVPPTHQRVVSCDDIWARTSRSPIRSLTEKIREDSRRPLSTIGAASPNRSDPTSHRSGTKQESVDFMATLTGDRDNAIKIQDKPGKFDSWFKGSSEPVSMGLPVKECEQEISTSSGPKSPNKLQRKSTTAPFKSPQASVSRFSFFSTAPKSTVSLPSGDDVADFDIQAALANSASPESYNPASFKALLDNAESVLARFQTAYKERVATLRELQDELEVQDDEVDEANTRADHLKMQLADMAEKFAAQEETTKMMAEELARERQLRKEEDEARKKSIALVKAPTSMPLNSMRGGRDSAFGMASDSGFESGDESASESIFPESRDGSISPTGTVLSYDTNHSSPEAYQSSDMSIESGHYSQAIAQTIRPFHMSTVRPPNVKRASTFQKVLNGIGRDGAEVLESPAACTVCQGAPPAIGDLRKENAGLKDRIVGLETALDGCLDLVGNLQ